MNQSGPAGPVRQIWLSGPVRSGNSYAQFGRALAQTAHKTVQQSRQQVLRAYCPNIYCDIYRQGRSSSILMNKTCTNDLLKVFVIHGQDNSWLTWNINAQWKNLHILFNNHKLSCTLSAALGVKTSAYFLNRKMPIKVKFKCCFGFFGLWIIWFCI